MCVGLWFCWLRGFCMCLDLGVFAMVEVGCGPGCCKSVLSQSMFVVC